MLTLIKLPTAWGIRNASAFNLKAEALLAMGRIPFESEEALPNKGPKGKLPALIDGETVIGDSTLIQQYLEKNHGLRIDDGLSDVDLADALAYRHMCEEWLYFIALHTRWLVMPNITEEAFFSSIPGPIRGLVFSSLRRKVKRTLEGQGLARHSFEEIQNFGVQVIDALDARIGQGPFFFGERIRSVDAALYPQLVNIADAPYDTPLKRHTQSKLNLIAYCRRCEKKIFD